MDNYVNVVTAQAPVNIAVIKYWGKDNEKLKIPINDSLSGTLNTGEMRTITSVYIRDTYLEDKLVLNGEEQDLLKANSPARCMLEEIRRISPLVNDKKLKYKTHIVSRNNFPTAAGLASSAAGYACLAYALGHSYGVTDSTTLSRIARKGSGSACRSIFGGFVEWNKGMDDDTSVARQVVDHLHWPEMRVIICVIDDHRKDVSSSSGMSSSVKTSSLLEYRAREVVPQRMNAIKDAIIKKDFNTFAEITMKDSNQFHAICMDTFPPLFYLNDSSREIIKICSLVNGYYGPNNNKVAYTFDAGPNACIYLLDNFVDTFIEIIRHFFTSGDNNDKLSIEGNLSDPKPDLSELSGLIEYLKYKRVRVSTDCISYLIATSIGEGPRLLEEHLDEM